MPNLINPILYDAPEKTSDEKEYIILYYIDDDEVGEIKSFNRVIGRISAYIDIAEMLNRYGDTLDLDNSLVLVETKQTQTKTGNQIYFISHPNDSHNLVKFIKFCQLEGNLPFEVIQRYPINIDSVEDYEDTTDNKKEPSEFYKSYMSDDEFYDNEMLITKDNESEDNNV